MSKPTLHINKESGIKYWLLNNYFHREDGPALIYPDGQKEWRLNGKRHRDDGPAVIYENGYHTWWLNGKHYSFNSWLELLDVPDEEKCHLKLKYL